MKDKISIVSMASVSALGSGEEEIWGNYQRKISLITKKPFGPFSAMVSEIPRH